MQTLILYALLTSSLFYLGSRALITRWLWSRYSPVVSLLMDCSACSGTWYGAIVGFVGGYLLELPFLGLPGDTWYTPLIVALCSMAWTPITAGLMQHGFDTLGHAGPIDDLPQAEPHDGQDRE